MLTSIPPELSELLGRQSHSLWMLAFALAFMEILDHLRRLDQQQDLIAASPRWVRWSMYCCTGLSIVFLIMLLIVRGQTRNPFLYAVF